MPYITYITNYAKCDQSMRGNNHLRQENADCGLNSRWQMANGKYPETRDRLYTIQKKVETSQLSFFLKNLFQSA